MKLSDLDPIVQLESDPLRLLLKLTKMTEGLRNEEQEVLRELLEAGFYELPEIREKFNRIYAGSTAGSAVFYGATVSFDGLVNSAKNHFKAIDRWNTHGTPPVLDMTQYYRLPCGHVFRRAGAVLQSMQRSVSLGRQARCMNCAAPVPSKLIMPKIFEQPKTKTNLSAFGKLFRGRDHNEE